LVDPGNTNHIRDTGVVTLSNPRREDVNTTKKPPTEDAVHTKANKDVETDFTAPNGVGAVVARPGTTYHGDNTGVVTPRLKNHVNGTRSLPMVDVVLTMEPLDVPAGTVLDGIGAETVKLGSTPLTENTGVLINAKRETVGMTWFD